MKITHHTRAIILLLVSLAAVFTFSTEGKAFSGARNRIFLSAGQVPLTLKAPEDMCFIDQSSPDFEPIYSAFKYAVEKKGTDMLLAIFTDCSSLGDANAVPETKDILLNSGIVVWTSPGATEYFPATRKEYLDAREPIFKDRVKRKLANTTELKVDDKPVKTDNSIIIGASGIYETLYEHKTTSTIFADTMIKGVPLEVTLHNTSKTSLNLKHLYQTVDNFINMQIILNE